MIDPDVLAIRRKRRREGRCLHCGTATPRAALCKACRMTRRYCPRCEDVYQRSDTTQDSVKTGRSTDYCAPCANVVRWKGTRPAREDYDAEVRRAYTKQVKAVAKMYRAGKPLKEIAAAFDMSDSGLYCFIHRARRIGVWPADAPYRRVKK